MCVCAHLVAEADAQLGEAHRMGTVGSQVNKQLDRLVHVKAGRQELGLALD